MSQFGPCHWLAIGARIAASCSSTCTYVSAIVASSSTCTSSRCPCSNAIPLSTFSIWSPSSWTRYTLNGLPSWSTCRRTVRTPWRAVMLVSSPTLSIAPTTTCCTFGAHRIRSTLWSRWQMRPSTTASRSNRPTCSRSTYACRSGQPDHRHERQVPKENESIGAPRLLTKLLQVVSLPAPGTHQGQAARPDAVRPMVDHHVRDGIDDRHD